MVVSFSRRAYTYKMGTKWWTVETSFSTYCISCSAAVLSSVLLHAKFSPPGWNMEAFVSCPVTWIEHVQLPQVYSCTWYCILYNAFADGIVFFSWTLPGRTKEGVCMTVLYSTSVAMKLLFCFLVYNPSKLVTDPFYCALKYHRWVAGEQNELYCTICMPIVRYDAQ